MTEHVRMHQCRPIHAKLYGRGFAVTALANGATEVLERHTHALPYFCFVVDGEIGELSGGRHRQSGAGSLLFHAQGVRHTNDFGSQGAVRLNVELTAAASGFSAALRDALVRSADLSNTAAASLAGPIAAALDAGDRDAADSIVAELLQSLIDPREPQAGDPAWLLDAAERVRAGYRRRDWSLDEWARAAGIHPSHLAREYRRRFGLTVGQHVRQLRLEYATAALLGSESLVDVALGAGYADQSHFSRAFVKQMGVTPAAFRAASRRTGGMLDGE